MSAPLDLVLVPGWGMPGGVWSDLIAHLPPRLRARVLALPGHDGAPFDPARVGLADWAGALRAATPPGAVWVGWSLGGLVALGAAFGAALDRFAETAADTAPKPAALVLIGTSPCFTTRPDWPDAMPPATLAAFAQALAADPSATLERFGALCVRAAEGGRGLLRRLRAGALEPLEPAALAAGLALLATTDLRPALPALPVPSLWVFGAGDALVPDAVAARIPALLPGATVATLAGAGHVPMLTDPARLAALIGAFVTRHFPSLTSPSSAPDR